jgi:hypothetical protein
MVDVGVMMTSIKDYKPDPRDGGPRWQLVDKRRWPTCYKEGCEEEGRCSRLFTQSAAGVKLSPRDYTKVYLCTKHDWGIHADEARRLAK